MLAWGGCCSSDDGAKERGLEEEERCLVSVAEGMSPCGAEVGRFVVEGL